MHASPVTEESTPQESAPSEITDNPTSFAVDGANRSRLWVVPALIVLILLGAMVALNTRRAPAKASGKNEISRLESDVRALKEELNRERIALGLQPREDDAESMDEITQRLSRDAETLVSLARGFQAMLAEKDATISAKNAEIIRSEQIRQAIAQECTRLQGELQRAGNNDSIADEVSKELEILRDERDTMAAALNEARAKLAEHDNAISSDTHADVLRQLDEITRARDFFQKRVEELEAAKSASE
ncbi:MAG: hypothetical protein ACO3RV_02250 [Luteolibacter sp.]